MSNSLISGYRPVSEIYKAAAIRPDKVNKVKPYETKRKYSTADSIGAARDTNTIIRTRIIYPNENIL